MSDRVPRGVRALSGVLILAGVLGGCSATKAASATPALAPITSSSASPTSVAVPHAATSSPDAATGVSSRDGACAYLTVSKLNMLLGRQYTVSKNVPLPDPASAAYCAYSTSDAEFDVIVATADPADAVTTFNQAAGNKLQPGSGVGDQSLVGPTELVAVFGQATIAASDSSPGRMSPPTASQLEAVVKAVHAAM
ncbi:hypothetical protein [Lapillicoccus sp.]|uniref:hypothetical protein n=1 Tax=Lapillicoccus sp. TaxID=1909287 RepID=UPI003264486E